MALTDLRLPPITFKKAQYYTEGRTEPIRAFVNHRMVGTLAGTDAYFSHPDRPVSTHFGIGYGENGAVRITQYVPLDDTAFGNGNYDPSGTWDEWGYKTTEVNPQTINIEHQDHGDPAGKGVVSTKTQVASQKLQALLRYGTLAQWRAAGITVRDWDHNGPIIRREIQDMLVDGHHVITHHDIAGRLKPYCWMPWENDKTGYPRAAYVTSIKYWGGILLNGLPDTQPDPPPPVVTYTQAQLDAAVAAAVANAQSRIDQAAAASKAKNLAVVNAITEELQQLLT
jgi:hypothetical protein